MTDELPILEVPDTPLWSENYVLAVGSTDPAIGLLFSIGRWHSDPQIWREVLGLALPGGRVMYTRNYGHNRYDDGPSASLARLQVVEHYKTLRLTFDGPVRQSTEADFLRVGATEGPLARCTVDLTFEAAHPLWDMRGDSAAAAKVAGSLHTEQIGRITGTIAYDGETFTLDDAYGARDHSRGPRDFSAYHSHAWLNGAFPSGLAFHVYGMELADPDAPLMSNAVVLRDGEWVPAQARSIGILGKPSDVHQPYTVVLDAAGEEIRIDVRSAAATVPMTVTSPYDLSIGSPFAGGAAYLADQHILLECAGEQGRGWADRGVIVPPGMALTD